MAIPTPVSQYKFNESSGNAADSVGSNTLTNNNTVTFTSGKLNNCAVLSLASSQSFSITNAAQSGLGFSGSFSWAGWIYPKSVPSTEQSLFAKTNGGSSRSYNVAIQGTGDGSTLKAFVSGDGGTANRRQATSSNAIISSGELNAWMMLGITFNISTGVFTFYKGGSSISLSTSNAGTVSSIYSSTNDFQVGCSNYLGTKDSFLNANIDNFCFWNSVLTSTDMSDYYNSGTGTEGPFGGGGSPTYNALQFAAGL